ncbi:RNA methyltransferase [Arachidicoccus ginsenosidimutans]|uniref:TrmH family RNA methyltransferase n=1 Tax=Arachidicoccus sp. BS20 TaxID=1850526 RepID=UPI0007F092E9|nr:RNA methyltransferase [Arachidicoccus sp. BS20]ANI88738.1 RNA methyltransferase [Arachidicoccus sp. BS20]
MTSERKDKLTRVLNHRQTDIAVVFENVEDPHNISAVLRTCESVGIQDVYILNHTIPPHPKFGKELGTRSSSSAWKWVSIHYFENLQECISSLKNENFTLMATHLSAAAVDLYEIDFTQKIALIFGNERKGVTEEMLQHCDGNFIVPQVGIIQSLNISVACAISIYEAFRQKRLAGHYEKTRLQNERLVELKNEWGLKED